MTRGVFAFVAAAMALTGCRCGDTIKSQKGEISIVYDDMGVTKTSTMGGTYDFGTVPMGKVEHLKLTVKNTGAGSLFLESLVKVSGDNVNISMVGPDAAPFVFELPDFVGAENEIVANDVKTFDITFNSPQDDTQTKVDHQVVLTLNTTHATTNTATITIKGTSVSGECALPKELDFGAVSRGDSFSSANFMPPQVTITNTRPIDSMGFVGDIMSSSGDDKAFSFSPDSPKGQFTIPSMQTRKVTISFSPTEIKDYLALVKMTAADGCPEVVVKLVGTGVDSVLTWAPNPLDFGYITPGLTAPGKLTFSNLGLKPVTLTNFVTTPNPSDFKLVDTMLVVPAASRDMNNNLVAGTADLNLTFKPTLLGPRTAGLKFDTDLPKQPNGIAQLKGYGGGPDINVKPNPIDFGRVAFFTGSPTPSQRKMTIQNVGTSPQPPDVKANLHLGMNGTGTQYWTITPMNADSQASEICVGAWDAASMTCSGTLPATGPGSYDPTTGIPAVGIAALLDVPITIVPASGSPTGVAKDWMITIFSNDPDEPSYTVEVTANAIVLPPCNYTITPLNLNFGLISPPSYKDLSFTVTNNGTQATDICLISSLDMAPGSDLTFSLPAGPLIDTELQPGQSKNVLVRAWPQGQVPTTIQNITGQVNLTISSPTQPNPFVTLSAAIAQSCLSIVPSDLNFGTVQKDCSSATRTFTIYNTCSSAVTVQTFSMVSPAGEPAGGPECPGTTACPEFIAVSTAGIAPNTTIQPGNSPVTFSIKYHPINYGPDNGAFLIKVTQNGSTVDYIVTLEGNGDTMGLNTDTFKQDTKPKADILLVVDNSCSMSDKQQALSQNFGSFIQYAQSANVDYQLGVTSTDFDDPTQSGHLFGDASNPKVLTPNTPNVESLFSAKVNLGTNGSGIEHGFDPALAALTPPLITSDNAGFLRNDAVLAVVSVSDADDQSVQPVSYYVNNLLNIKGIQRANMFTWNAVAPLQQQAPAGCTYDGTGNTAPRYSSMVQQTNGVLEEICTPDWAKSLQEIGKNAFGYRTTFYLTATPDLTGGKVISVSIDGMPLSSTDSRGATVWSYDATANAVNFQPLFVPEPGQTLTITYYVACIP